MKKVDFTKLNSANVSVDNLVDESRVYDINARVNLNEGNLHSVDGGIVIKEGVQVATFSMWSNNLNPSFQSINDPMEMCNILMAITAFIGDTKTEIETNPIEI